MRQKFDDIKPGAFFADGETMPYINISFRGGAGSGKSYTAGMIAKGIWESGKCSKGVIVCDTEQSMKFLRPLLVGSGVGELPPGDPNNQLFIKPNPSLADVCRLLDWMDQGNADIMIIDSLTKIHKEYVEDYRRQKRGDGRLQMLDWDFIKTNWAENFSDRVVNGRGHVIMCGRLGNIYEFIDDGSGKKELVKTGHKQRGDSDTAYESDINVEMQRREELDRTGKDGKKIPDRVYHVATVLKSRYPRLDGKQINADGKAKGPKYEDFKEAIEFVVGDGTAAKATERTSNESLVKQEGDPQSQADHQTWFQRLGSLLAKLVPAGTPGTLAKKSDYLAKGFDGETSMEAVKQLPAEAIQAGYLKIQAIYYQENPTTKPQDDFFGPEAK